MVRKIETNKIESTDPPEVPEPTKREQLEKVVEEREKISEQKTELEDGLKKVEDKECETIPFQGDEIDAKQVLKELKYLEIKDRNLARIERKLAIDIGSEQSEGEGCVLSDSEESLDEIDLEENALYDVNVSPSTIALKGLDNDFASLEEDVVVARRSPVDGSQSKLAESSNEVRFDDATRLVERVDFEPNTLHFEEAVEIQEIAERYGTQIDVVGSRASGRGRGIDQPWLPEGKGPGTRSDIDFRYDTLNSNADDIARALNNVSRGAGNAKPKHSNNPTDIVRSGRQSYPPVIVFNPGQPPAVLLRGRL